MTSSLPGPLYRKKTHSTFSCGTFSRDERRSSTATTNSYQASGVDHIKVVLSLYNMRSNAPSSAASSHETKTGLVTPTQFRKERQEQWRSIPVPGIKLTIAVYVCRGIYYCSPQLSNPPQLIQIVAKTCHCAPTAAAVDSSSVALT